MSARSFLLLRSIYGESGKFRTAWTSVSGWETFGGPLLAAFRASCIFYRSINGWGFWCAAWWSLEIPGRSGRPEALFCPRLWAPTYARSGFTIFGRRSGPWFSAAYYKIFYPCRYAYRTCLGTWFELGTEPTTFADILSWATGEALTLGLRTSSD